MNIFYKLNFDLLNFLITMTMLFQTLLVFTFSLPVNFRIQSHKWTLNRPSQTLGYVFIPISYAKLKPHFFSVSFLFSVSVSLTLSFFIYMCIYIYICMYVYIYTYILYIYIHTYIYIYIYTLKIVKYMKLILLLCILIYPLSTLFTLQYKQYIYKQIYKFTSRSHTQTTSFSERR